MHTRMYMILGAALAVGLLTNVALAAHNEPKAASGASNRLVTAYEPCLAPNDSTAGGLLIFPACNPPVRSDALCSFGPRGAGSLQTGLAKGPDLKIVAKLTGLTAGCEGHTMALVSSVRITTDNCVLPGPCTATDLPPLPFGTCVVSGGKCSIRTTVNKAFGAPIIVGGDRVGIEFLQCGMQRQTGPPLVTPGTSLSFSCGLLIP